MYSLLVLGIVPGTNIQITFQGWLSLFGSLVVAAALAQYYRQNLALQQAAARVRVPLHASQLHHRG